ncbi:MAG: ATP-binding protein [Desulfobacteraceae bacterium]
MNFFYNLSLKNKIFTLCLVIVVLVSFVIALFTRWLLVSSLTGELKKRGTGIAQSIADNSREFILTEDKESLTTLVFDAKVGNRKDFVRYMLINDVNGRILAHTFLRNFPEKMHSIVEKSEAENRRITEIDIRGEVFHVTVPVKEGIYTIGSVHVGVDKDHIQKLIAKLRFLFFSFLSVAAAVFFGMSHYLSRQITKPVSSLITYTDRIRKGHYDIDFGKEELPDQYSENDEFKKLMDSFIKMTSRIKESREELLASETKYRSLFTSGPNPIFVIDRKTLGILDASPKAYEGYGYNTQELLNMKFTDLGDLDEQAFSKEFPPNESTIISSKVELFRKNGDSVFVNIHASPADYRGKDALIVATTNITELVEKDTQLIQASKMANLEKMSAGIAHELNQPLNAIKMGSEYLIMMNRTQGKAEPDDLTLVAGEISTQVSRASEIVDRLKHFSRKTDFSREIIDVNNCIREIDKIIRRELFVQDIDFELELDDSVPLVMAHNNRIEQVIFNLVTNARDSVNQRIETTADKQKGRIRITTVNRSDKAMVVVSDNGTGIEKSEVEKIFESFYTTKKMGEGLGLGLPIIQGIVKDYEGDISVESQPGEGTDFIVTLPALRE